LSEIEAATRKNRGAVRKKGEKYRPGEIPDLKAREGG